MEQPPHPEEPNNKPVATGRSYSRPKFKDVIVTWTGRILILNTIVFIVMSVDGGGIFLPSEELLIHYGAKSSYHLIHGEWWRLFTPVFVHIGIIHFGLNSLALFYIGAHIEKMLGPRWFLAIYLLAGLAGGIGSAVFIMGISAGASGAIFGLLGVGFVFERFIYAKVRRVTGEKLRRGPYTGLVVINVMIGLILTSGPIRIDNGAHLGGLLAGIVLTLIMLYQVPNKLVKPNPRISYGLAVGFAIVLAIGAWLGTSAKFMRLKVDQVVAHSDSPQTKYEYLTDGIRAFPEDKELLFKRGELLIFDGDIKSASEDFEKLLDDPTYFTKIEALAEQLKAKERLREYVAVKRLLQANEVNRIFKL